ncbi:hypothetical protein RUMCAL_00857 [Ruminococcus callidus ATCC 27760]|uniref:Uncharacterized protein n=1 Tax=Ruminococcus callidus ATCC 27760 TaxID=411473 RepID=U2KXD8_9FIRM|nr:hypothetical protein RUMCAL_00857 [Ruminococcus callidus ATCC 27760]
MLGDTIKGNTAQVLCGVALIIFRQIGKALKRYCLYKDSV